MTTQLMTFFELLVFTLQSIKSRIETKTGEKQEFGAILVFTLQSIKSRIETKLFRQFPEFLTRFLLYSPLNQGLKQIKSA